MISWHSYSDRNQILRDVEKYAIDGVIDVRTRGKLEDRYRRRETLLTKYQFIDLILQSDRNPDKVGFDYELPVGLRKHQ